MKQDVRTRALWAVAFIAAYVALAKSTEGLTLESGYSPWYPPAGLSMAYLLLAGPRGAPVVLAARWLNTWVIFPDAWRDEADGVIVRGIAIVAVYTVAAAVLRRVGLRRARLHELGWFAAVGVIGAPLVASIAVAFVGIGLEGVDASDAFDSAWTFWIGDAVAVSTVVPAVLLLAAAASGSVTPPRLPPRRRDRLEVLLQSIALIVAPVVALSVAENNESTGFLVLAVLPVVWVALRRDLVLAAVGLLLLNSFLSLGAAIVLGASELSELQAVMLAASLAGLYIAAVTHTQEMAFADLIESEDRYRAVLGGMPCLTARFSLDGDVQFVNEPPGLAAAGGAAAVIGPLRERWDDLVPGALDGDSGVDHEWDVQRGTRDRQWFSARLGPERLADGTVGGVVAVISHLTPVRQAELERERERSIDPLTGLLNRQRFFDLLGQHATWPDGRWLGVAMIDLDGFKHVNDALDLEAGDAVLRHAGDRLRRTVGGEGLIARLAADEFAVAVPVRDPGDIALLGERLVSDVRIRVPMAGHHILVTCSVGVAMGTSESRSVNVVQDAESALTAAKATGGACCVTFEDRHRAATVDRETRMALLHECIDRRTVVVHYQPLVDLRTGQTVSLEALARLPDPAGGLLPPSSFIPLAEESGLDVRLGALVLDGALEDLSRMPPGPDGVPLAMAVNVTARQLMQTGYVHHVLAACRRHGIAPDRVCLELTETLVMADPVAATRALRELRAQGMSAALDDFGVGYSAFSYLQKLPIDILKIDRSFVMGLPDDPESRAIVGLIVGLAEALGMTVTAEGIEDDGQRAALVELGCHRGQGYLFGRPVDADAIAARLAPEPAV